MLVALGKGCNASHQPSDASTQYNYTLPDIIKTLFYKFMWVIAITRNFQIYRNAISPFSCTAVYIDMY